MKILALEREAGGKDKTAFTASLLKAEARKVWDLQQSGVIREIYFRADRTDAVLVLECPGIEEAQRILSSLPLVQAALVGFELIPLAAYTGFSRLFADDGSVTASRR